MAANDCLSHRGPDSKGSWLSPSGKVFLGHRRLSSIDLHAAANQPMTSSDGRFTIVYNGEVYNFRELKKHLPDFQWRTQGDTEVVLELFAAFGTRCFSWLNGMFALAIYDEATDSVVLARDQIGIKPLFYQLAGETIYFGSELKSLVALAASVGKVPPVEGAAIPYFLHLGYIPEPWTIYQNVFKFPAGHFAIIPLETLKMELSQYWSAEDHYLQKPISDHGSAFSRFRDIAFAAVNDQMVSDVPLGTFLSGGIDSSLVTAIASKVSSQKVRSFTIGFEEKRFDESGHAAAVAKHLGTEHHTFHVAVDDVLDLIPSLLEVYDEPFADSSAFPTMLVSRLARQHVTVTLSGDGGDELFQGYGMYTWANRLNRPLVKLIRKPAYYLTQQLSDRYRRGGLLFNYPDSKRIRSHIFSQEQYFFGEAELANLLCKPDLEFDQLNAGFIHGTAAEQQAAWDLTHYLKDDLLVKVDRASMRYSLETRVPLLDLRMVEFAMNLDYSLKVRQPMGTKLLMKQLLYELVPEEIFKRPKRGFSIPLQQWLRGPLKHLVEQYLNPGIIKQHGVVRPESVNQLLRRFESGEHYLYNRIWLLLVLHWWLEDHR